MTIGPQIKDSAQVSTTTAPPNAVDEGEDKLTRQSSFGHLFDLAHGVRKLAARRIESLHRTHDKGFYTTRRDCEVAGCVAPALSGEANTHGVVETEASHGLFDHVLEPSPSYDRPRCRPLRPTRTLD